MSSDDRAATIRIRDRLKRSWFPLFAHHAALTPVQRMGIPLLLDRRECLLCAPTASGKTEALIAAPFEEIAGQLCDRPQILYVCPTRALVSDTWRRVGVLAQRLGIRTGRRTGDHRQRPLGHDLLITTPESFDSLMCRAPSELRAVRWLLLDELHQVAGLPRGDQLAALTWRLRRMCTEDTARPLTVVAASATVAEADRVAGRYLIDPEVVMAPPSRRKLGLSVRSAPTVEQTVEALTESPGKTLVFANSRNDVEQVTFALRGQPPFGDAVFAHHGSLHRAERERVEAAFLTRRNAICVATMTLELGIDIGDVDRIALYGPPSEVSSLLQRIGRGGRRTGRVRVMLLARTPPEILRFEFLLDRAEAGDLCAQLWPYHPASVIQQAGSLLMQNRRRTLTVDALLQRLPPWQARYWTPTRVAAVLRAQPTWFVRDADGRFRPGDDLARAFDRGQMHSQIEQQAGITVLDELTHEALATVAQAPKGSSVLLAGHSGTVVSEHGREVRVRRTSAALEPMRFVSRGAPVRSRADATAYLEYLGVPSGCGAALPGQWFHGLGQPMGRVLAWAMSKRLRPVTSAGGLVWEALDEKPPTDVPQRRIEQALTAMERALARMTCQGPDFASLPPDERRLTIREALPPDEVRRAYKNIRWVEPTADIVERLQFALEAERSAFSGRSGGRGGPADDLDGV